MSRPSDNLSKHAPRVCLYARLGVLSLLGLLLGARPGGRVPTDTRDLAQEAAREAGAPPLIVDAALGRAAQLHARDVLVDARRGTHAHVRWALMHEGLSDAQVLPFTAVQGSHPDQEAALLRFAKTTAQRRGLTHVGVGRARAAEGSVLVALFSRRSVSMPKLPLARKSPYRSHRITGRGPTGERLEAFVIGPCPDLRCAGERVRTLPVQGPASRFAIDVPLDRGPGRYIFELLSHGARGPEVAALWTFFKDRTPAPPPIWRPGKYSNDLSGLQLLLNQARHAAGREALPRSPRLDRAAQSHAEASCRAMIAAHVLQGGRSPIQRAKAQGHAGPVTENVAIASSVDRAHYNLMRSPSHRRNILMPAEAVGLGFSKRAGAVCVVQMFQPRE